MAYTLEYNGQTYTVTGPSRYTLNKLVDYGLFEKGNIGPYKLDNEDWNKINNVFSKSITSGNSNSTNWKNHPATGKQLEYLATLQVRTPDNYQMTKGHASQIIESVKSGNGLGSFNLFFMDGSN